MISKHLALLVAAGLALPAISAHAQDVTVTAFLTFVPAANNVFDYTLTLKNTGPEAIESLWLGWVPGDFDIDSPTNVGNDLGWASPVVSDSVEYGGSPSETFLASGATGTFTFDSTSTPADFMSESAGPSVAYGVDAQPFAIEGTTLHSVEFSPEVVPEPSTVGLLVAGALAILGLGWRRRGTLVPVAVVRKRA